MDNNDYSDGDEEIVGTEEKKHPKRDGWNLIRPVLYAMMIGAVVVVVVYVGGEAIIQDTGSLLEASLWYVSTAEWILSTAEWISDRFVGLVQLAGLAGLLVFIVVAYRLLAPSKQLKEHNDLQRQYRRLEKKYRDTVQELADKHDDLQGHYRRLEEKYRNTEHELRQAMRRQKEAENSKHDAIQRQKQTELEKQDALRRLSQMVSVKLRENNPNIVDLNDQHRPTKLAELFSELYDNEWTGAYTVLEDQFQDSQIISFLLDIVMESYEYTRLFIEGNWTIVDKWYLDKRFPWYEQTRKALRDGRKILVFDMSKEVEKNFSGYVKDVCGNTTLGGLLSAKGMTNYLNLSVKLCLLMNATDPPVVIECPDWKPLTTRRAEEDEHTEINTYVNGTAVGDGANDNDPPSSTPKEMKSESKQLFDKERYKEYTKRGKFLDFYVWPAMFLQKNGAMLGKGVAQGTRAQCTEQTDRLWKWWK